eukprot:g3551.t1
MGIQKHRRSLIEQQQQQQEENEKEKEEKEGTTGDVDRHAGEPLVAAAAQENAQVQEDGQGRDRRTVERVEEAEGAGIAAVPAADTKVPKTAGQGDGEMTAKSPAKSPPPPSSTTAQTKTWSESMAALQDELADQGFAPPPPDVPPPQPAAVTEMLSEEEGGGGGGEDVIARDGADDAEGTRGTANGAEAALGTEVPRESIDAGVGGTGAGGTDSDDPHARDRIADSVMPRLPTMDDAMEAAVARALREAAERGDAIELVAAATLATDEAEEGEEDDEEDEDDEEEGEGEEDGAEEQEAVGHALLGGQDGESSDDEDGGEKKSQDEEEHDNDADDADDDDAAKLLDAQIQETMERQRREKEAAEMSDEQRVKLKTSMAAVTRAFEAATALRRRQLGSFDNQMRRPTVTDMMAKVSSGEGSATLARRSTVAQALDKLGVLAGGSGGGRGGGSGGGGEGPATTPAGSGGQRGQGSLADGETKNGSSVSDHEAAAAAAAYRAAGLDTHTTLDL